MFSHTFHKLRTPRRAAPDASMAGVTGATRVAGAALAVLLGAQVQAAEPTGFVLTMYSNGAGFESLKQGRFEEAIREIPRQKHAPGMYPSMLSTNLCVAQVMAKQLDAARTVCAVAIREARSEQASLPSWQRASMSGQKDSLAMAYANRAVLHWLNKDKASAAGDMAAAKRLAPTADFVARNLAALDSSAGAPLHLSVTQ